MRLGGMDKQVENAEKLATGLACCDWNNCRFSVACQLRSRFLLVSSV